MRAFARYTSYCCAVGSAEIQTDEPADEQSASLTAAELVLNLRAVSRALQTFLIAQARASGLGLLEFLILTRAAQGDGVTARDAGRQLGLNTSTMTGLTDRLEQDKLIRRQAHPDDRRVLLLRATPKGQQAIRRTLGPLLNELAQLADTLGADDQRALIGSFLKQVTALIDQHAATARPRPASRPLTRDSLPRRPRQSRSKTTSTAEESAAS